MIISTPYYSRHNSGVRERGQQHKEGRDDPQSEPNQGPETQIKQKNYVSEQTRDINKQEGVQQVLPLRSKPH